MRDVKNDSKTRIANFNFDRLPASCFLLHESLKTRKIEPLHDHTMAHVHDADHYGDEQ